MDASQGPARSRYHTSCCLCRVSSSQCCAGSTKAWILNWNSLTRCNETAPSPFCMAVSEQWRRDGECAEDASACTRVAAHRKQDVTFSLCGVEEVFILECIKPPPRAHGSTLVSAPPPFPRPTCSAWNHVKPSLLLGAESNKAGFTYHETERL